MAVVLTTAARLLKITAASLFRLQIINWNTDYYEYSNKCFELELVDFGFFPDRQNGLKGYVTQRSQEVRNAEQ
jgi:hypothetical protein